MSFNGNGYEEYATTVITSKGDIVRGNSAGKRERYGIGSSNQVLSVSSGEPVWTTLPTASSVLTTQGDILFQDASGLARLGQSTDGHVLTTKGAGADPIWSAIPATPSQVELLDTYSSGIVDTNTHTFNFSPYLDLLDVPTYSELWLICNFNNWNYTIGQVECRIGTNGSVPYTTGYGTSYGYQFDGTTMTQYVDTTNTSAILANSTTNVASTGLRTFSRITALASGGGFYTTFGFQTSSMGDGGAPARKSNYIDSTSYGSGVAGQLINAIQINTAGNWDNYTNFSIYGVKFA
tara:strand:+ start:1366 stop:2244 length:879 start_codon:yes stop_codon:yes gene_type:complete